VRWHDGTMALCWCAAGMAEAGKQFRRVNGDLHLPALRTAREAEVAKTVSSPSKDHEMKAGLTIIGAATEVPRNSGRPPWWSGYLQPAAAVRHSPVIDQVSRAIIPTRLDLTGLRYGDRLCSVAANGAGGLSIEDSKDIPIGEGSPQPYSRASERLQV
jgi:hypothetical protein